MAVEFKKRISAATVWQIVQMASERKRFLLVADEITADARKILTDRRIPFIDGLGNAHVELPGLLVHLEGRRRPKRASSDTLPVRLKGKAGIAGQALLLDPDRDWHVQDLANEAGIAKGLAHRIVTRLERDGIMVAQGAGPHRTRRVSNPTGLVDLWAEEQTDKVNRIPGHLIAQSPQQLIKEVGARLERASIEYAYTGAAGASLVAPFVTSIPVVEIWVTERVAHDALFSAVKAEPVSDGQNLVFLLAKSDIGLAFREKVKGLWIGNRFRLYADLRRDPRRGREQAEHLRREVIKL